MSDFINAFLHKYPFQTLHELNLDWLISAMKELAFELKEFEAANTIHYAGDFDITKQYPAWSIVVDNNIGYISTKPVPAGIAVTDTEYWEVIADFTSLIGDLGSRVVALEDDVSDIQKSITRSWQDRKIIFVGDSYGRGRTYVGQYGTSWCDSVVAELAPAASYNMSVSSASFSPDNTDTLRFGYQLKTFVDGHTTTECKAITDIIIAGGVNEMFHPNSDIVNSTTIYCAYWTANFIKQHFPYARVFLGFIGRLPFKQNANFTYANVNSAIAKYKQICTKYSWNYIANSEYMCHEYINLTDDAIHFKTTGYINIGKYIAQAVNSGFWSIPEQGGFAIDNNFTALNAASVAGEEFVKTNSMSNIYTQLTADGVQIFQNGAFNVLFDTKNIDGDKTIELFKYTDPANEKYQYINPQYDRRIPCTYTFMDSSYNQIGYDNNYNGWICFREDGICVLGHGTFVYPGTVNNCSIINISMQNVTFPLATC